MVGFRADNDDFAMVEESRTRQCVGDICCVISVQYLCVALSAELLLQIRDDLLYLLSS